MAWPGCKRQLCMQTERTTELPCEGLLGAMASRRGRVVMKEPLPMACVFNQNAGYGN